MKKSWYVGILTVVIFGLQTSVFAEDWPHWRGPHYDGISRETQWNPQVLNHFDKPLWSASVGIGFSAVSVADGKAVTMGNVDKKTDRVVCFDAVTGKELWAYTYDEALEPKSYEGGPGSTPTIADGKVYTLSKSGKAFCLDLNDGSVIWQKQFDFKLPTWGFAGSVLLRDDRAIYNVGSAGVAVNRNTGEILWQSDDDAAGYSTGVPVNADESTAVVMALKDTVKGLDPQTGKVLWSFPWETKHNVNAADPILRGSEVFVTSGYGHGSSLWRIEDGSVQTVWENKSMRTHMSGPVLIGDYLYGFDDNALACVEWKTGEQKWSEKSTGKGSLSAAGERLIVISEKGKLIIAEATPEKYTEIASAQVLDGRCWTMPVLANGRIYVRNAAGTLVCVDVSHEE